MKKVLCFGDSNTYGYNPKNGARYDLNTRWTGILQTLCGNGYEIIEAGCNNRTAFSNNPYGIELTGCKILPSYLSDDLDFVILGIGINDLQKSYNPSGEEFKAGMASVIEITRKLSPHARIILLVPSSIKECILKGYFGVLFDSISVEKSKRFGVMYRDLAAEYDCDLLDLNEIAEVSDIDGLHYTAAEHKKIAAAVFNLLEN